MILIQVLTDDIKNNFDGPCYLFSFHTTLKSAVFWCSPCEENISSYMYHNINLYLKLFFQSTTISLSSLFNTDSLSLLHLSNYTLKNYPSLKIRQWLGLTQVNIILLTISSTFIIRFFERDTSGGQKAWLNFFNARKLSTFQFSIFLWISLLSKNKVCSL